MFAMPQLRLIFLSLFISSFSFAMEPRIDSSDGSSDDEPIKFTKKSSSYNKSYKSKKNYRDEKKTIYSEQAYQPKGRYSDPSEINSNYKQFIETAPELVTSKIVGLKECPEIAFENSFFKRLLLYGEPGNGKTSLAKAIGLEIFQKYYYIPTSSVLDSYKNCHSNLLAEINPLIEKGEPIAIIWDEMNCVTDQHKNHNSSDEIMPTAFSLLLDYCEEKAPFLFMIGTTNNHPDDFPEKIDSRFDKNDDRVFISCPDFSKRQQIMNYRFKGKQSTLTKDDKKILLEKLEGRTCRNIVKVLDKAIAYSLRTDKIITRELIDLSIDKSPCAPSKYQRIAQKYNRTEDEIRAMEADKALVEQNRGIVDQIQKEDQIKLQKDGLKQAADHYQGNLDKQAENIVLQTRLNLMTKSRERSIQVNGSVTFGTNGGANIGGSATHSVVTNEDYQAMKNILPDKEAAIWDNQDAEAQARVQPQRIDTVLSQEEEEAKIRELGIIARNSTMVMILGAAIGGPVGFGIMGIAAGLMTFQGDSLRDELKDSQLYKETMEANEKALKNIDWNSVLL